MTPILCELTQNSPKWSGKVLVSCQAGKEPIDQGILHQQEQSQDLQTNTTGPTCQHTRANQN